MKSQFMILYYYKIKQYKLVYVCMCLWNCTKYQYKTIYIILIGSLKLKTLYFFVLYKRPINSYRRDRLCVPKHFQVLINYCIIVTLKCEDFSMQFCVNMSFPAIFQEWHSMSHFNPYQIDKTLKRCFGGN